MHLNKKYLKRIHYNKVGSSDSRWNALGNAVIVKTINNASEPSILLCVGAELWTVNKVKEDRRKYKSF